MHKNVHRFCDSCWEKRKPGEIPARVKGGPEGPCCVCDALTSSGIYVFDKGTFGFCDGNHSEDKSSGIPFIGFSNETLEKLPPAKVGDTVKCRFCGEPHILRRAEPKSSLGTDLLFFSCGGKTHLAAVGGKLVAFQEPDVSGGSKED